MFRLGFKMPLVPAKKQKIPACIREIQVHKLWTKVNSKQGLTAMHHDHWVTGEDGCTLLWKIGVGRVVHLPLETTSPSFLAFLRVGSSIFFLFSSCSLLICRLGGMHFTVDGWGVKSPFICFWKWHHFEHSFLHCQNTNGYKRNSNFDETI